MIYSILDLNCLSVNSTLQMAQSNKVAPDLSPRTLIITLGPFGAGKTTIINDLVAQFTKTKNIDKFKNTNLIHVDGDLLNIGSELTLLCGSHRNDLTKFLITKELMAGNIPIYSGGGGAICDYGKAFNLIEDLLYTLKVPIEVILLVPGENNKFTDINWDEQALDKHLETIYSKMDEVKTSIVERINVGRWKLDPRFKTAEQFADFMCKKSADNIKFARLISQTTKHVFCYPWIYSKDFDQDTGEFTNKLDYSSLFDMLQSHQPIKRGHFTWVGKLVQLSNQDKLGHITNGFMANKGISFGLANFESIASTYEEYKDNIPGYTIELTSNNLDNSSNSKKKPIISFAVLDLEVDINPYYSTHVTLRPGQHAAKEMKVAAASYNCYLAFQNIQKIVGDMSVSLSKKIDAAIKYFAICEAIFKMFNGDNEDSIFSAIIINLTGVTTLEGLEAAIAVSPISSTVGLPISNGKSIIKYDLSSAKVTPCEIKVLTTFGY